ncbi:ATP-binding protein, partial [[Clostridium] innocuum]|nr:ATP-binding protein [[Clostridium] innocuum]
MLYQILPRYDHQFQADTMRMFLKTLSGTKRRRSLRDRLSKLFDPNCILDYRFIIDCDGKDQTDGMISFYLQVSDERENGLVLNSLQNMFQDKANVFEAVRPLTPYTTVHTLFTDDVLDHAKDTKKSLATFRDDQIFLFILGTMRNKTRITIDFSVEKNYSATKSMLRGVSTDVDVQVMIKVSGKTRYQRNQILEITNTIINLTAGEKELRAIYRDTYKFSKLTGNE